MWFRRSIISAVFIAILLVLWTDVASADSGVVHVVRRGETLTSIAARYGTTVTAIVQANGLRNRNFVWHGQRLRIPTGSRSSPAPVGRNYSPAPASGGAVHVVRRGENLASIAWRYGTSVQALAQANGLRNPNFIWAGQRLVIPGRTASSSPQPAAQSASPATPSILTQGRWIDIDLSSQTLTAYVGDRAVYSTLISSGLARTPTPVGRFTIQSKYVAQTMIGPGYRLPNVPHVMYFHGGYAIHGTYWHNNFGRPMSHGCVNLSLADAAWLYNWAGVGTPVVVKP